MSTWEHIASLVKRINIPSSTGPGWSPEEVAERQRDPWTGAGKYGRGWVYFSVVLLTISTTIRFYHTWGDRVRIALHKENPAAARFQSPQDEYELPSAATDSSTTLFFPAHGSLHHNKKQQSSVSTVAPLNNTIAFARWIFYRSLPELRIGRYRIVFPSLGASAIILAAFTFVTLYCFLPQPLYYSSIRIGSPPLAIRAGMLAVAMVPWIMALSTRANFISMLTGIGHERLNVLHRWAGYICLFLSLIHMIPFYIQPIWEHGMLVVYQQYLPSNIYVYGTGLSAFVPLAFLCVHSLPILRAWMYELFVKIHLPVSLIFVSMLFWHTKNFLSSWGYLWATIAVFVLSYAVRLFYLNWTNPLRLSFMIGEDSAVTILPQNAIKVTVPTQMRWKPGQYVYLRMPGIAFFQNHPFTVASLCSDDLPSDYGEEYRDLALVFRPFRGFTRNVLRKAIEFGPFKTWTAFIEGPYGGMRRQMAAFDDVIFFAGGSGITAIASHLLDLIKKMREGKAVTKSVRVIWALRDPESIDWFKEELRICRDHAPLNSVHCYFYLTGAKDDSGHPFPVQDQQVYRDIVQEKIYDTLQEIEKRSSAYIREEAAGDEEREKELRRENEDTLTALPPRVYTSNLPRSSNYQSPSMQSTGFSPYQQSPHQSPYQWQQSQFQQSPYLQQQSPYLQQQSPYTSPQSQTSLNVPFDFGFGQAQSQSPHQPQPHQQPSPPQSQLQPQPQPQQQQPPHLTLQTQPLPNNVPPAQPRPNPRFASLPLQKRNGWKIDYTRPDIPKLLNDFSKSFGRRTCVYVCGPPGMRMDVSDAVARLQWGVLTDGGKDEIFLHAENYNI
ncbi:ferric reductase NAD binding domain-containing protein [Aspergillus karnatakaensis]|uniref:putative metalloreductase transmembrane component n=1 Tax=Aspergillus karnatakaensis TaxID=1810916 RepID=UPI003CCCAE53